MGVIQDRVFDASGHGGARITSVQRAELCAWLAAHELDPRRVVTVERGLVDCPLIKAEIIRLDEDGNAIVAASGTDLELDVVEVAEHTPPPDWWRPA
jgi:hypothetical protein